jgi:hypothetical protein
VLLETVHTQGEVKRGRCVFTHVCVLRGGGELWKSETAWIRQCKHARYECATTPSEEVA